MVLLLANDDESRHMGGNFLTVNKRLTYTSSLSASEVPYHNQLSFSTL